MIVADQRRGLQPMDEGVGALDLPVGIGLVPHAIEPDPADRSVLCEQLGELRVHVVEVAIEVPARRPSGEVARPPERPVVRVVPVEQRIVEEYLDALTPRLLDQHLERILPVRRRIDDVPAALPGGPHGETIVVFGRDRDVLHPGALGERDDCARIKVNGVELRGELLVLGHRDVLVLHDPLAARRHAVDAPMDEHAEAGVLEPRSRGQVGGGGSVRMRPRRAQERSHR